ncbi:MAG: hypothetical protein ABIL09_27660, partial [Gemmatimonadota bacterium]
GAGAALPEQLGACLEAWAVGCLRAGDPDGAEPDSQAVAACLREAVATRRVEAAALDRTLRTKSRFRSLAAAELEPALAPHRG